MSRGKPLPLAVAAMLAATALQGCSGVEKLNFLAAIDGPYISPSEREEMARREAELAAVPEVVAEAEPAPMAAEVAAPPPVLVASMPEAVNQPEPAPAGLTSVGPDFLPPDLRAPAAPIPATVSAAFIGPVLPREELQPPAPVATRLPSAFDYTVPAGEGEIVRRPAPLPEPEVQVAAPVPQAEALPAAALAELSQPDAAVPAATAQTTAGGDLESAAEAAGFTVVSAMPGPVAVPERSAAAASASSEYSAFFDFAVSRLAAAPSGGARQSMLLLDPPSLDPELQPCANRPPAVLVDLDPANGLLPLVSSNRASPELVDYLARLRERGVTIYWISGHAPNAASRIRQRLTDSALDPDGIDPLIVTRFAGESKQERRYALGESHCLLAILGDHRGDFDELYDFVLDPIMAGPLEVHVGKGWFIAPPPLD